MIFAGLGIVFITMAHFKDLSLKRPSMPLDEAFCCFPASPPVPDYDTTLWTELTSKDGFIIDVRYATTNNFTGAIIYPCGRMFMRPEPARALKKILKQLKGKGYQLKLFDGYRPSPAQQKLWDKVPDPDYVAPPSKGSMHNRGVAIDLTLTDLKGKELDMGTPYDFFGPEAHHDYTDLSVEVLERRRLLKSAMESNGFKGIRTEWWHYSFLSKSYPLDKWEWPCPGAKH
jgi:D-alanyl-D-alanine dipeptidase